MAARLIPKTSIESFIKTGTTATDLRVSTPALAKRKKRAGGEVLSGMFLKRSEVLRILINFLKTCTTLLHPETPGKYLMKSVKF